VFILYSYNIRFSAHVRLTNDNGTSNKPKM